MEENNANSLFIEWYVDREEKLNTENFGRKMCLIYALRDDGESVLSNIKVWVESDIAQAEDELGIEIIITDVDAHSQAVLDALKRKFL